MANEFIARKGYIALEDSQITGSLSITGNITGSTFSGSFVGDGSQLGGVTTASYVEYNDIANKPTLVSGSEQISFNGITDKPTLVSGSEQISFNGITDKPTLVSGSSQITYSGLTGIPSGIVSGSAQITYSGLTGIPSGIVSGSAQIAALGYATTGSNGFNGNQAITGSLTVTGQVIAQSLNVQQVTSSIVYSSGSNVFGSDLGNTQQFTGSISITGSGAINGITITTNTASQTLTNKTIAAGSNTITGLTNANLSGTAGITNANLANSTISGISLGSNLAALTIGTGLSGISYNGSTAITIANTGVTSNVAGTGISVSGATGAVTITNTGVTSATAGTGISLNASTGGITITNSGVTSLTAGTGIGLNAGTGGVTVSSTDTLALVTGRGASTSTDLTFNGTLTMGTGGTQFIRMGRFPSSVTNTGEAWIGRASDRSAGTMTVQLGTGSDRIFEVVDHAWSTVILGAGMNSLTYKGNNIWHAGNLTNPVTGTGTSGQVAYFTGTSAISSESNLFWDATNNRLGINQSSPLAPLHVGSEASSDDANVQRWDYAGSSAYQLILKQTVTSGVVRWNFSQINNSTTYNNVLVLDRGNVGIGITNPSKKLHVYTSDNEGIFLQGTGGGIWMDVQASGGELWSFGADTGGAGIYNRTDNAYRLYANNAGNVGIGLTSPASLLHVAGTVSYGSVRVSPSGTNGESAIAFFTDTAGTDTNDAWVVGHAGWGNTGDFVIGNENNGAGGNVRLLIEKAGNVGINTTSPSSRLSVCSTTACSTVVDVQGCAGQLFSITDNLVGEIFAVSDISGIPILSVNSNGTVSVDSKIAVGANHTVSGAYASVTGGRCNTASGGCSTISGGYLNTANESGGTLPVGYVGGAGGFVGGGTGNLASGQGSVVVGGVPVDFPMTACSNNIASGLSSFVGAGAKNCASGCGAAIVGGGCIGGGGPAWGGNTASGTNSFIGGGSSNTACGTHSVVAGGGGADFLGRGNTASGGYSAILGGMANTTSGYVSTIGGGGFNTASSFYTAVLGGMCNVASGNTSTVGGGFRNLACGYTSIVGGGNNNTASGYAASVLGGRCGVASATFSAVGNGNAQTASSCNEFRVSFLSKASGTFRINHPDPSKQHTHYLSHSFVESPTAGDNIYRYKVNVVNGTAVINLPSYYKYLNENDQIWVTPQGHFGIGYGTINTAQTELTIYGNTDGEYNVLLIGTRKDTDAVEHWQGTETYK